MSREPVDDNCYVNSTNVVVHVVLHFALFCLFAFVVVVFFCFFLFCFCFLVCLFYFGFALFLVLIIVIKEITIEFGVLPCWLSFCVCF